jgi:hypothetical protein
MIAPDSCERFEQHVGLRVEWRGTYHGRSFSVVTGWDVSSDRWPVHVYIDGAKCDGLIEGKPSTA